MSAEGAEPAAQPAPPEQPADAAPPPEPLQAAAPPEPLQAAAPPPRPAGLSAAEAAQRLAADGPNELPTARPRSLAGQAWEVLHQPMLLLLLGAGGVNFLLGEPLDGAVLLSFVAVVIAISVYQANKTEHALVALRDLSSPRALVVRDGEAQRVPGREVVRGDVVVLSEGDRVPADGTVLDCVNLFADESALSGEPVPVRKVAADASPGAPGGPLFPGAGPPDAPGATGAPEVAVPGGDNTPWVFSGSVIVKGRGLARIAHTGASSQLGRIGHALSSIETSETPLQRAIGRLVGVIALVGAGVAAAVVVIYGLVRGGWLRAVLAGIATAMALLPEEFPVVLTVFMALGGWRLSRHNVLTRRAPVIETLGSATVICADKTGTLTQNRITVARLTVPGQGTLTLDGPQPDAPHGLALPEAFHALVEYAVLASEVDPFDPIDRALRALGESALQGTEHLHSHWQVERTYPLSDRLLALSQVWRSTDSTSWVIAAKGAPEAIADLCHLPPTERAALSAEVERAAADGLRVLAVAQATVTGWGDLPSDQHDFDFTLAGLLGLEDPLRPGVAAAVAECRRAGIRTVMITGDYVATAQAIAAQIGFDQRHGALTGPELAELTGQELTERVREVNVFARMVPDQKLQLVRALQAGGDVVAMTGDGVNDAPALRAADIGIAMGARGTDVAREAAALVVTDDDFGSIVQGVRLGRGVFNNLRRAMAYIVAVHVPIVGLSLLPLVVEHWPLVLGPAQIAFLELIIDPACSIVFEAEEIDPAVMDQPPRSVSEPPIGRRVLTIAVAQGLAVFVAVASAYLWAIWRDRADDVVRAVAFTALVASNLGLIVVNRSWRLPLWATARQRHNPTLKWIVGGATAMCALVLTVPPLRGAFALGRLSLGEFGVAAGAGAGGVVWFELYKSWRATVQAKDTNVPREDLRR